MLGLIVGGHGEKTIVHSKNWTSHGNVIEGIIHNIDFSSSQSLANIQICFENWTLKQLVVQLFGTHYTCIKTIYFSISFHVVASCIYYIWDMVELVFHSIDFWEIIQMSNKQWCSTYTILGTHDVMLLMLFIYITSPNAMLNNWWLVHEVT